MKIENNEHDRILYFAPNAFGKTLQAKKNHESLIKDNNVQYFTDKTVQQLVKVEKDRILVGPAAASIVSKNEIEKLMNQSLKTSLLNFAKKYYGVKNATGIQENSYYIKKSYSSLTNFNKAFTTLFELGLFENTETEYVDISLHDWNCEEIFRFDKEIDQEALREIQESPEMLKESVSKHKQYISKEEMELIDELFKHISQKKTDTKCPLCGYDYKTHENLIHTIKQHIDTVSNIDLKSFERKISDLWRRIRSAHNDHKSFQKMFDNYKETLEQCMLNVKEYLDLINEIEILYKQCFQNQIKKDLKKDKINVDKNIEDYNIHSDKIDKFNKKIINNTKFIGTIKVQFDTLVSLPDNLKLIEDKNSLRVKVGDTIEDPYEVLSTSEIKRLILAVLYATIKETNTKHLILDDPIDSYDEYYFYTAVDYINEKLIPLVDSWLITTHHYDFALNFSASIEYKVLYGYYVFDPEEPSVNPKKRIVVVDKDYLDIFRDNELILTKQILNNTRENKFSIDKSFAMLALIMVIRTFKNELVNPNLLTHDNNKKVQKRLNIIESNYLHAGELAYISKRQLIYVFNKWLKVDISKFPKDDIDNNIIDSRVHYLEEVEFEDIESQNVMLKVVLYKILMISYCKYMMDTYLVEVCKKNLGFTDKQLRHMLKQKGFKKKMSVARRMYGRNDILEDIESLYKKNKNLINDFSHSASRLFPPYLVTHIKDIHLLKKDIKELIHSL